MELFQIRYFLAVAEHLSFTRAARALNLSQPPLSQQIRRLEQELGGPLFIRDTHGVRLSDLGEAFVPRARQISDSVSQATDELRNFLRLETGLLRVGASGALAYHFLPFLLRHYRQRHPAVEVQIVERRTAELLGMAEDDAIDLALIHLPHGRTRLETHVIATEPLVAALPPDHPLSTQTSVTISDLANEPIILTALQSEPYHKFVRGLFEAEGLRAQIICSGSTNTTACRLVGLGMGISIVAEMTRYVKVDPMPVFVPLDLNGAESAIGLLSHPYDELTAPAKAFFDIVVSTDSAPWLI